MTEEGLGAIGRYKLTRKLGSGGMGTVYEGYDALIDRRVAIKKLHPHLIDEDRGFDYRARLRREAQAAARCMHPNIVTVLEFSDDDQAPYIVMEYVEGMTLDVFLSRTPTIQPRTALSILSQVLKALDKAHGSGIVHRDIKPSNILMLKDGTVKLADFGIARLPTAGGLTQVGAVLGTPDYMAPEQGMGNTVDQRSDLFAIALIFLELLQRAEFGADVPLGPLPTVPGLPSTLRIDYEQAIPLALVPVLSQALAYMPEERFTDARALSRAIRAALQQLRAPRPSVAATNAQKSTTIRMPATTPLEFAEQEVFDREVDLDEGSDGSTGLISQIDDQTLTEVRTALSTYLDDRAGPAIRSHAKDAISFAEFIQGLAGEISRPKDRKKFLQALGQ